jgi:hypothetical protein
LDFSGGIFETHTIIANCSVCTEKNTQKNSTPTEVSHSQDTDLNLDNDTETVTRESREAYMLESSLQLDTCRK